MEILLVVSVILSFAFHLISMFSKTTFWGVEILWVLDYRLVITPIIYFFNLTIKAFANIPLFNGINSKDKDIKKQTNKIIVNLNIIWALL